LYPLNVTAFGGAQRACDITNSTEGKLQLPTKLMMMMMMEDELT